MKRNYILGTIWIAIALLLTVLLVRGFAGNKGEMENLGNLTRWLKIHIDSDDWDNEDWGYDEEDYDDEAFSENTSGLSKSNTYEAEEIKIISTELRTFPVEIYKSSDSKIYVNFEGNAEQYCTLSRTGSKILIKEPKRKTGIKYHINGKVYIALPESFSNELELDSVSGSIKIRDLKLEEVSVEAVSGSVTLSDCDIKKTRINCVSGSAKVDGNYERLEIETVSGSIKAETGTELSGKCNFESVSGSIHLSIPASTGYSMEYETMSGSFKDEIAGISGSKHGSYSHGDGRTDIEVSTVSGSIKIEER